MVSSKRKDKATSISQMFNALGVGVSFLWGTALVREVEEDNGNNNIEEVKGDIKVLLYMYTGVALVISGLIYIYFPSVPPSPPSTSAQEKRSDFFKGLKDLVLNRNVWLVMLTYASSNGILQMWQTQMVVNLTAVNSVQLSETFISTMGIVISFVSVFGSILFAGLIDMFRTKMKLAIVCLLFLSGTMFIFITLFIEEAIQINNDTTFKVLLYVLLVSGITLSCSCAPIAFEFCVELAFPVDEGTIGTWLTLWFANLSILFLLVFQIPNIGTQWLNYVLAPCVLIPIPLMRLVKEEYRRQNIDTSS